MDLASGVLIVLGLCAFEIVSSMDNAVVNAEVLGTMTERGRRWFLTWGILIAVFLVRGTLPWLIIWAAAPSLGPIGALTMSFSDDPRVVAIIEESAPILLIGGGVFLLFLFFHWLFLEEKHYGLPHEAFIHERGLWFYAVVSVLLSAITWFAVQHRGIMAFGAVVGSTAFFITHGFKQNAEEMEKQLIHQQRAMSDVSKILYLEVLDASFSIDGVLGAFAFTLSVPLILIGNGIGAIVLRQLTVGNIERVKRYRYLKNGAMYSIGVLGTIMILESFGMHVPHWVTPVATFVVIGYFLWLSVREMSDSDSAAAA